MFGLISNLVKTAASIVIVPVAVVADVVTLGGAITDSEPCTPDAIEDVVDNIQNTIDND